MNTLPTRQAIFTPSGRGAVATVGVIGPQALEMVARRVMIEDAGQPLAKLSDRVLLRRFRGAGGDEKVVLVVVGPHEVEIHCHGGAAAVEGIAAALEHEGAARTSWQALAQELAEDQIQAEARIALAAAPTARTCTILLDQFRGALARELTFVESLIANGDVRQADERLSRLEALAPLGLHLIEPWKVVLAGPPNVGKSSLVNALLGYERSIVFDQPGTTRDVLTAVTAIDGWPVELSDTAGLRDAGDSLEAAGVERSRERMGRADCVLLVMDANDERDDQACPNAAELFPTASSCIVVGSKCDLLSLDARRRWQQRFVHGILTSAKTGAGIADLHARIGRELVASPPQAGEAVPFLPRHAAQLAMLRQRLASEP